VRADLVFGVPIDSSSGDRMLQTKRRTLRIAVHPVGRAAWVGMFATALNLLPVGQLDGGHIVRSVSPQLHRWISLSLPIALVPLGYFQWQGWWIWALILFGLQFVRMAADLRSHTARSQPKIRCGGLVCGVHPSVSCPYPPVERAAVKVAGCQPQPKRN